MLKHNAQVAVVVGHEPPVSAVVYHEGDPAIPTDSGFTLLLTDAPDADDLDDDITNNPRISTLCLHCIIERWPETGRGLDLARQHGDANRDDTGHWA